MSHSGTKNRHQRITARMGRKKFRAAEKRVLHGDNIRTSRYSHRWGGMGAMKQDDIPIDPKEETP